MRITRECTMPVGPLCYAWSDNGLGAMLGEERRTTENAPTSFVEVEASLKALEEKPAELEGASTRRRTPPRGCRESARRSNAMDEVRKMTSPLAAMGGAALRTRNQ